MKKKFESVMVIDDEELDLFLAEKILKGNDIACNMIFYNNARLALRYLNKLKKNDPVPQLILLDLSLPEFSGEDFLLSYSSEIPQEIKEKIKIVVLTAYKYFHEAKEISRERFPVISKIIEKPLNIDELRDLLYEGKWNLNALKKEKLND